MIVGTFPIGDSAESFIVAEWVPDPKVVAQELLKLSNDLLNWTEPLVEARAALIYDTELHFETQSDPFGQPWTALDEAYLKSKLAQGYPEDTLVRDGHLKKAATSESAWLIKEHSIVFDAAVLPFYGEYHQRGTTPPGLDIVLHKIRTGQELTRQEVGVVGNFGRGMNLPQRMFIGADEDTIQEIEGIFLNWVNKLVDTDIPAFGGGFTVRGPGGKFVGIRRGI